MLAVLERLGGFWAAEEPSIDAWFAARPTASERLQWPRRSRLVRVRADLALLADACDLAAPVLDIAPRVFTDIDEAAVLGWLYVTEGSTLGGAVIARVLGDAGFAYRLATFTPYPEGPQPMWRSYLAHLEAWTADDAQRVEQVVAAGCATFSALECWIAAAAEVAA